MPWQWLGSIAVAYALVVVLVFLFQSHLVYYPGLGRELAATPRAYGLDYEEATIVTEDGERLHAWWMPAREARGAVLLFHGNAGNISHRLDYALMFRRLGYSTLLVDYRGYGRSTGSPSEDGLYRDALASWRWLVAGRGLRPADIVLYGESLGGAVASWLAAHLAASTPAAQPRALVLASTFTSITDLGAQIYWFLPVRLISRLGYDNLAHLQRVALPVMVIHSRGDEIVPFAHGERLYAAARGPKQLLELQGGHNDGFVFLREDWTAALAGFLERAAGAADGAKKSE
jgi:fermentation-respiration switch protein FrsA (DUF1100 family)